MQKEKHGTRNGSYRNVFRQFEAILLCHAVKDFQEPVVVPGHHNTETDEFSVKMLERGTVADDQPVFCAGFKQLKRSEPFFHYFQKKKFAFAGYTLYAGI